MLRVVNILLYLLLYFIMCDQCVLHCIPYLYDSFSLVNLYGYLESLYNGVIANEGTGLMHVLQTSSHKLLSGGQSTLASSHMEGTHICSLGC